MKYIAKNGKICDSRLDAFIEGISGKSLPEQSIRANDQTGVDKFYCSPIETNPVSSPEIIIIQNEKPNRAIDAKDVSKVVINKDHNVVTIIDQESTYEDVYTYNAEQNEYVEPASIKISDTLLERLRDYDDSFLDNATL